MDIYIYNVPSLIKYTEFVTCDHCSIFHLNYRSNSNVVGSDKLVIFHGVLQLKHNCLLHILQQWNYPIGTIQLVSEQKRLIRRPI